MQFGGLRIYSFPIISTVHLTLYLPEHPCTHKDYLSLKVASAKQLIVNHYLNICVIADTQASMKMAKRIYRISE